VGAAAVGEVTGVLSCDQMRALDARAIAAGIPGAVLMENAGRGAADLIMSLGIHGRIVICAGKGNNGGDGFVIARHLAIRGVDVRVLVVVDPAELTGDAATHFQAMRASGIQEERGDATRVAEVLAGAEWAVDALLGTGLTGTVRAPYDTVIDAINRKARRVFAVDIPSGLDADTGQPLGVAVRAEHTATFAALKQGFARPQAAAYLGTVHLIDIGIPNSAAWQ
jgi:NAD(P)H-hydrate epimerase